MTTFLAAVLLSAFAARDSATIRIALHPAAPLIERTSAGQELNFDFLVANTGRDTVEVRAIEVSVYDVARRLVLRRFLDDNGSSPSIETVARRRIAPGARALLFNPFHTFANDVELKQLRYRFTIARGDSSFVSEVVFEPTSYQPKSVLRLPLAGRVIVYDGHDHYAHHRRLNFADAMGTQLGITANFMRYGYDFMAVDSAGEMSRGDVARNESWFGFGRPVLAPGAGRIVQLKDDAPDNRSIDMPAIMQDPVALYGNYIVIDHLNGEFSMLGHIRQGSARVRVGDSVAIGQPIAAVGAAGSAFMPHLHYELRTGPGVRGVEGLPSYFRDYTLWLGAGSRRVSSGAPATGEIVSGN